LGARLKHLSEGLRIGYFDPDTGLLWAGHWLAFTFAVCIGAVTLVLDVYRRAYVGEKSPVPALAYVLILLLNLNWILAFFAFLLDRYRVPLLVPLALFCAIGAHSPSSDHFYSSQSGIPIETISPEEVLRVRQKAGRPIILVATAGGGIQAAAWTTQVLSGLQKLSTKDWKTKNSFVFAECLTLVSSVSGGATGSMYFLNLYGPDSEAKFQDQKIDEMNDAVKESSLDDIAWAMMYRDFLRIVFPYLKYSSEDKLLDRGYMLEETWRKRGSSQIHLTGLSRVSQTSCQSLGQPVTAIGSLQQEGPCKLKPDGCGTGEKGTSQQTDSEAKKTTPTSSTTQAKHPPPRTAPSAQTWPPGSRARFQGAPPRRCRCRSPPDSEEPCRNALQ